MNTLKHILTRYTAFLWALLKPLGVWGVFVIAAMDGAAIGLPMDVVVATYVYQNKSLFLLYALLAAAGSAVGSSVLYLVGYIGGETFLRKRMSEKRFEKIHRSFDQHEFWALMFPAMLPPPTPFKLFVLSAAVFEMNFGHFLVAIFAGRFIRFFLLGLLTIRFGPGFVDVAGKVVTQHWGWLLAAVAAGLAIWLLVRKRKAAEAAV
ncbi:MAG TPA: VTT domain-containing protein [Terriglobales bacterium]|nr:VTT domain-containing protein [Terriglobales bacterium]